MGAEVERVMLALHETRAQLQALIGRVNEMEEQDEGNSAAASGITDPLDYQGPFALGAAGLVARVNHGLVHNIDDVLYWTPDEITVSTTAGVHYIVLKITLAANSWTVSTWELEEFTAVTNIESSRIVRRFLIGTVYVSDGRITGRYQHQRTDIQLHPDGGLCADVYNSVGGATLSGATKLTFPTDHILDSPFTRDVSDEAIIVANEIRTAGRRFLVQVFCNYEVVSTSLDGVSQIKLWLATKNDATTPIPGTAVWGSLHADTSDQPENDNLLSLSCHAVLTLDDLTDGCIFAVTQQVSGSGYMTVNTRADSRMSIILL